MSVSIAYSDTADGYLIAYSYVSVADAVDGGSSMDVANPSDPDTLIGRSGYHYPYRAWEAFYKFAVSPPADERVVTAHSRFVYTGPESTMEWRQYDWGAAVDSGDWRTGAQLTALDELCSAAAVPIYSGGIAIGGQNLTEAVRTAGTVYFVGCTTNQRLKVNTGSFLYLDINTSDVSGTSTDPAVMLSSVPESTLHRVIGAQVQLSDGTWAVLDTDGASASPTVTLEHVSLAGSASTIATLSTGTSSSTFGWGEGMQGFALVADDQDNIVVLGRLGNAGNTLAAQAFTYSGGSWTPGTIRSAAMPTSPGTINQVVGAWHDIGTSGTIVALVAHGFTDPTQGTDCAYALLDMSYLLTGSGSMLRGSGNASTAGLTAPAQSYVTLNGAGSLTDVTASSSNRGYVLSGYTSSGTPPASLGTTVYGWAARYILSSGGTVITAAGTQRSAPRMYVDSEAKCRVLAVDDTRMLLVTARPSYGIAVEDLQNIGTSTSFSQVGITYMDGETASMPSASVLGSSALWDVIYDETANAVYLYYFDVADGHRLIRTTVDLSTHLAAGDEEEIDPAVGAAGSTNHMLRVARGGRTADATLISVGNEASGGTLSTVYVVDASNLPPTAPTLTARDNYDGTASATFDWTFNDPNPGDVQGAYQLQINTASGASAYDTGKISTSVTYAVVPGSTLTNPGDWQWRVLTYDAADTQGEWSTYDVFSTGASGIVNITDPATDNPELTSNSYTIQWSVSGVTQDHYRVVVVSTVTGGTLSDTGYLAGTDTSYEVTGMTSDVQYQVQVTAQASGVDTNTDTVLLTPDYSSPERPTFTLTAYDTEAYILVSIVNPTPEGDRPEAAYNDVLRRVDGSEGDYTVVGTAPTNGAFRDYTAASGVTYEYVARASTGADAPYTDADSATEGISFLGLWIHDPLDPEGTVRQLLYGQAARSLQHGTIHVGVQYAGRSYPVFDYGEQKTTAFAVQIDVPHGADWRTELDALAVFADQERNVVVRDSRGRSVTGAMAGYNENDQTWGTQVSFTVTRAHEETVTA